MDSSAGQPSDFWILAALTLAAWPCLAVWMAILSRAWRGRSILKYEPRRPVPWGVVDLVVVLVFSFVVANVLAFSLSKAGLAPDQAAAAADDATAKVETIHPIGRLLLENPNGWTLAVCLIAAVVAAPLVEEFLFRLLVQGWLEAAERRARRRMPRLRSLTPGAAPVAAVALLFAAVHFRIPGPPPSSEKLVFQLGVTCLSSLLVVALGAGLVRFRTGATLRDLGIVPRRLPADLLLGVLAWIAVTPPVYFLMVQCKCLLPANWVVDPFPLFFLALALGYLYYKTHRIVPAIVLHALFNATSVAIAWLLTAK